MRLIYLAFAFISAFSVADNWVPEGFGNLKTSEVADLDVYFQNQYLGKFVASFDDHYIKFDNINGLRKALVMVENQDLVMSKLTGKLAPHTDYVCHKSSRKSCQLLNPKVAGVVLDRHKYRATIFINHQYLKPASRKKLEFYQPFDTSLAALSQYQLYVSGSKENLNWTLNNDFVISKANQYIIIENSLQGQRDDDGRVTHQFRVDDAEYNYIWDRYAAKGGLLNTDGLLLLPTVKVLGAQFKTDHSLMANEHINYGTPIEVNLTSPGTVQVLKDGKVIYSRYYNPGNYFLDTRYFPSGVYEVTVQIKSMNNIVSSFQRLYTRNGGLPAYDYPEYSATVGVLSNGYTDSHAVFPTMSSQLVAQVNYQSRISNHSALQIGTIFDRSFGLVTIGIPTLGSFGQIYPSIAIDSQGDYGFALSYQYSYRSLSLNLLTRRFYIKSPDDQTHHEIDNLTSHQSVDSAAVAYQIGGHSLRAAYSRETQSSGSKSRNASVSWRKVLWQSDDWTVSSNVSANRTNDQNSLLGTLNLSWRQGAWGHSASGNYRFVQHADHSWYGNYTLSYQPNQTYRFSTQLSQGDQQQNWQASAFANYDMGDVSAHYYHRPDGSDTYNYQVSFDHFGFVWHGGQLVFSSSMPEKSGVLLHIQSTKPSEFDVTVDGQSHHLSGNQSQFFSLPALQEHQLSIASKGQESYLVESVMPFSFYPNTVMSFDLKAKRYYTLIGTFMYPNHRLVKDALIDGGVSFASTDHDGYSEVDLDDQAQLTLEDRKGLRCVIDASKYPPEDGLAYYEEIICQPIKRLKRRNQIICQPKKQLNRQDDQKSHSNDLSHCD
jgi:hypothetical protein